MSQREANFQLLISLYRLSALKKNRLTLTPGLCCEETKNLAAAIEAYRVLLSKPTPDPKSRAKYLHSYGSLLSECNSQRSQLTSTSGGSSSSSTNTTSTTSLPAQQPMEFIIRTFHEMKDIGTRLDDLQIQRDALNELAYLYRKSNYLTKAQECDELRESIDRALEEEEEAEEEENRRRNGVRRRCPDSQVIYNG